jgi:hypothetical protein
MRTRRRFAWWEGMTGYEGALMLAVAAALAGLLVCDGYAWPRALAAAAGWCAIWLVVR